MNWAPFIVGVAAIFVSAVIFVVQRYSQVKYGIKAKQQLMKEKQKLISDAYKTKDIKDPKVQEELSAMQKEMMSLSMEVMKSSFKNMLWIMIFSLLVFAYIATFLNASFPVGKFLGINPVFVWYILVSLVANIVFKLIFVVLEKKNIVSDNY